MLITGKKIIRDKLLESATAENISGGCYYLQIHSIIPAGEGAKTYDAKKPQKFYVLEPGGMAWIISQETFGITDTSITALVTLRSGFTKQGMLALDVGLVDANFAGPIGSLVINFSKNQIRLNEGDQFFRVMFLKHDETSGVHAPEAVKFTHEEYIQKILTDTVGDFPSTFLQTAEMEDRIRDSVTKDLAAKLEPELLDKLATRFLAKNWGKITIFVLVGLTMGYFANFNEYFHSTEQIQRIVDERLEALESEGQ